MTAFNVVRFQTKPGCEEKVEQIHRDTSVNFPGFIRGSLIKTGDISYCMIGEWDSQSSINASENDMVSMLDSFRDLLEDLDSGMGVTDPVAGEVMVEFKV